MFFYFLAPFFSGIIAILLLMKFSKKTNFLVDVPKGDILKIHKKNIPLLGGLAIALSIAIGFLLMLKIASIFQIIAIALGGTGIFLLGFWDDLKWKHISTIKPLLKFSLLIICTFIPSVILAFAGIRFDFLPVPIISVLLGFIYIFVSLNAVNYQDGMDGLAGGLAAISLVGFLAVSIISNAALPLYVSLVCLGAVAAFLCFNLPPAKVFMGDSGAYSLGFILAVLAILFSKPYNIPSILGPIFIIGLPVFDGVFTNLRRIYNGKSIFLGDRSHFYDRLLQKGFSTKKTLTICYFLQILLVLIGISIYV